jgi:hypothetical protein
MRKLLWVVCAMVAVSLPGMAQQKAGNPGKTATEAQRPEHPITVVQVHELMTLTGADHLKNQVMAGMIPYVQQAMPFMPADVLDEFQARMGKADFEPMMVQAYQKHLSTEDAAQLIAFYKTPTGQRVIAALPAVVRETQEGGARMGQQIMGEVIQAHRPEIEAAVQRYKQEHAQPAPQAPQH